MKLVVGLGNPGRQYEGTRHNIGFDVLGELAARHRASKTKQKFTAKITDVEIAGHRVLLLAPQTYMNASGQSVQVAMGFYRLEPADLLVICDDMNLPPGKIRLRPSGSAGGQKGLKNIIDHLHTEAFSRLRIGIGGPPQGVGGADFVLRRFSKAERKMTQAAVTRSAEAVQCWLSQGIDAAMNEFNAAESI